MQGNVMVRGRGRDAPVITDGYENDRHKGGKTPPKKLEAKLLETPSRPYVITVTQKDGTRKSVTVTPDKIGNA